ncbi:hypothetical protein DAPPUDRAFT_317795 [Daphnia pulex]|uniref:Uncharacterized protein n=1 Tax=Daphnia pulex TaxID=6669 RepID=E9GGZ9_DAPPU|nr:hypothetical protein DAPPUDRAFT_317795 [Daphnia pulex]|eukprot:EFX81276.1 hypothetical protein DAPPUDRAFT_317795 [Daphnia pulex]
MKDVVSFHYSGNDAYDKNYAYMIKFLVNSPGKLTGKISNHANYLHQLRRSGSLLRKGRTIVRAFTNVTLKRLNYQHPCLADNNCEENYVTVKHKVFRAVGFQIDYKKYEPIRNLKRNHQIAGMQSGNLLT